MTDARIIRHDPATALSPLFRPLPGMKVRPKLDVRTVHGNAELHWRGPDMLGIPEETLLLVILELARATPIRLSASPRSEAGVALRAGLGVDGHLAGLDVVQVQTSFSELARHCGLGGGGADLRQVRTYLKRLVEVTLWIREGGLEGSTRLLSHFLADDATVCIAVNRRLAAALVDGQYVQVSLTERLALAGATARALHARLSAQIRPGKSFRFALQSIENRIWGEPASGSTQRNRHSRLRAAMDEIGRLENWQVEWKDDVTTVHRKSDRVLPGPPEKRRQRHGIAATHQSAGTQSAHGFPGS